MSGVSGRTSNKLFRVKTRDLNNPYQVGVNGVTDVKPFDDNILRVSYTLDGIDYVSFTDNISQKQIYSRERTIKLEVEKITKFKKITNKIRANNETKIIKGTNRVISFEPDYTKQKKRSLNKYIKTNKRNFLIKNINEAKEDNAPINNVEGNINRDTLFFTKKLSFENFIEEKITKNEKFVGLIGTPNVTSDVFMERDYNSVFEKHQRLSEINNLSELTTYRNGYFNVINSI